MPLTTIIRKVYESHWRKLYWSNIPCWYRSYVVINDNRAYLYSLVKPKEVDEFLVTDTDLDLDDLIKFHDHELDGWFGRF